MAGRNCPGNSRAAPTAGLAIPYDRVQKPRPTIGVVLGKLHPQDAESVAQAAFEQLKPEVDGALALPRPLPAPAPLYRTVLDGLLVWDDLKPTAGPYDWSPLPSGKSSSSLEQWFSMPWGGPEQVILPGFHTAAENGIRKSQATGNELFLALCGLMSTGSRTILISRWRTGGQTSFDLVREFMQELPHVSPAEAWQRSVKIASDATLEPEHEPRIKKGATNTEPPKADHPLFWAGYLLVDSGVPSADQDKALALPGLDGPKKDAAPPPANAPRLQGIPILNDLPGLEPPNEKRGKKAKAPDRSPLKKKPIKAPASQKPAPSDPID